MIKNTIIDLLFLACCVVFGFVSFAFCHNLEFNPNNSAGIIVTVLGVLVTALIGWQVFNAIEVSRQVREMHALKDKAQQSVAEASKIGDETTALTEGLFLYNLASQNRANLGVDTRYVIFLHIVFRLLKANVPHDYAPLVDTIDACKGSLKNFEEVKNTTEGFIPFSDCYEMLFNLQEKIEQIIKDKSNEFDEIKKDLEYIRNKCDELHKDYNKANPNKDDFSQILRNPFKWASSDKKDTTNNIK